MDAICSSRACRVHKVAVWRRSGGLEPPTPQHQRCSALFWSAQDLRRSRDFAWNRWPFGQQPGRLPGDGTSTTCCRSGSRKRLVGRWRAGWRGGPARLDGVPSALPDGQPAPRDGALPDQALATLGTRPFGIYVHVPFCTSRCGYCDFNTYTPTESGLDRSDYVTAALGNTMPTAPLSLKVL